MATGDTNHHHHSTHPPSPTPPNTLLLDLEVHPHGKVLKLGAILNDRSFSSAGQLASTDLLTALANLIPNASAVLGHNLADHDLPTIRQAHPNHPVLKLPIIDTLILSPIAFPENPYHRLVKDYKLLSESVNDPLADAALAGKLFEDELRSLSGLAQTEPDLLTLLHFLLATPENPTDTLAQGMHLVFTHLGSQIPQPQHALHLANQLAPRWACASFTLQPQHTQTRSQRHALAYALTWLRVAGSNSVLPPWIRLRHPTTVQILKHLREIPCQLPSCSYCQQTHNPHQQLKTFFGFNHFRPTPSTPTGASLQQEIVEAGMREESLLAILPTGGGKSLCYQLPALTRNYRRGTLTIVISPLQALMKDQVDGLVRRTGTPFAAALYGLLTTPERADVLRRVRTGDIAILYISPEQLRNRSLKDAIAQREIGCWVFDEAHCLSKWGHDFRTDYLYAGRFIREFAQSQNTPIPPIACFTATAKRDVRDEIIAYFKTETARDLQLFEGGVERTNLRFEVQAISGPGKMERTHLLLSERLTPNQPGCAIVFRSTRKDTELTADYLRSKGWITAHFHAGLTPPKKKETQDSFLNGHTQVICATNAFGMGIDKDDVRLVIHADTPGSLENYLQEAGRAGRDGQSADCILLFDDEDCEQQFRMEAFSELSRRDIAQILRTLRRSVKPGRNELVITSGEILRDEEIETDIDLMDRMADTKVRTAISWLERAGFVSREENVTSVFQARLLVQNLTDAHNRIAQLQLSQTEKQLWIAIIQTIINTKPTDPLTVDQLALLPELLDYAKGNPSALANPDYVSAKILRILANMAEAGLLKRDLLLNAFVSTTHHNTSLDRLNLTLTLDRQLVDTLSTAEPDPENWVPLSLPRLNQALLNLNLPSTPDTIRSLLKSLQEDGRNHANSQGCLDIRHLNNQAYRVRLHTSWTTISELAERRRQVATIITHTLLNKIPPKSPPRKDTLVDFTFEELLLAIEKDENLRIELRDPSAAIERALMFLHEQRIITLQQGLAVFRSAMTIRLQPNAKGARYQASHYQPLQHHYEERILQVHVMGEYARQALQQMSQALDLVLAYFSLQKEEFTQRYLKQKLSLLQHATTATSFESIVTSLQNPHQIQIVTAPTNKNLLVLAGPGSGKTRTVVHRCAYLLRVQRTPPRSILVCCFNRSAATELRKRLTQLVGNDARHVTILTYHGLALRLLGKSLTPTPNSTTEPNLNQLIPEATALLRGQSSTPGTEPDELRDRLLAGFQFILVDEYQDIDHDQYELISAIAGRTLEDPELKLSILAVGDDDQNIYSFRGTNVEFIRRFQQDYQADLHYLVENYRSTTHIIEASNQLIALNTDRMKSHQPVRINEQRALLPAGGEFSRTDPLTRGRVQIIQVQHDNLLPHAVIHEILRLQKLGTSPLSKIAVLSAHHRDLARIRYATEQTNLPIRWSPARKDMPPLHQIREIHCLLHELQQDRSRFLKASQLHPTLFRLFAGFPPSPWSSYTHQLVDAWQIESSNAELPAQNAVDFIYENCADDRRDFAYGDGILLSTIHAAKGTEHDHVLVVGSWPAPSSTPDLEASRRLLYVGMTRARQSLTIFHQTHIPNSIPQSLSSPSFLTSSHHTPNPPHTPHPAPSYNLITLEDLHLSYPALFQPQHPIHKHLSRLSTGDPLFLHPLKNKRLALWTQSNHPIALLSQKGHAKWSPLLPQIQSIRVIAMLHRHQSQSEPEFQKQCKTPSWELPLAETLLS